MSNKTDHVSYKILQNVRWTNENCGYMELGKQTVVHYWLRLFITLNVLTQSFTT